MIKKIENVIKNNIEAEDISIDLTTSFKDDLGLDSFEMAQLLCSLEDELGISLEDSDILKINTIEDLINCIERK